MWIKRQTIRKKTGQTYDYVYLAQSYRDDKGRSRHRHIARLDELSETQIANLEKALRAGARGQAVVVADGAARNFAKVSASLRYLEFAVLLQLWREWCLNELFASIMPRGTSVVEPADVVLALVLQRAVEPDSKLAAVDWFARTALPELLGVPVSAFGNSRIHRVLAQLDKVEPKLQARLPYRCRLQTGHFASLFLDATDTFFVGEGPSIARRGKTKEGRLELKIGILLLCNERGEPLQWKVVQGNSAEAKNFHAQLDALTDVEWARGVPIVVDRAMGHSSDIVRMANTGLHFVTALRASEYNTYAPEIPRDEVGSLSLELGTDKAIEEADCKRLVDLVKSHDFELVSRDLLVRDLGVREIACARKATLPAPAQHSLREALETGLDVWAKRESGELGSFADVAKTYGRTKGWVSQRVQLSKLSEVIRKDILAGNASHLPIRRVLLIARKPLEEQPELYFELKSTHRQPVRPAQTKTPAQYDNQPGTKSGTFSTSLRLSISGDDGSFWGTWPRCGSTSTTSTRTLSAAAHDSHRNDSLPKLKLSWSSSRSDAPLTSQ